MKGLCPWASHDQAKDIWTLRVLVHPGAKKNQVIGPFGERIKLKIAAPSVDNKANIALIQYLAELAGVSPSRVEIVHGMHARQKSLRLHGAGADFLSLLMPKQKTGKT